MDKFVVPLMRAHRHTIMDGRVVTFAAGFKNEGPGALGLDRYEPTGTFEVSASRNAVIVHRAELVTQSDSLGLVSALGFAWAEHENLKAWGGRPKDDDGTPREVTYNAVMSRRPQD